MVPGGNYQKPLETRANRLETLADHVATISRLGLHLRQVNPIFMYPWSSPRASPRSSVDDREFQDRGEGGSNLIKIIYHSASDKSDWLFELNMMERPLFHVHRHVYNPRLHPFPPHIPSTPAHPPSFALSTEANWLVICGHWPPAYLRDIYQRKCLVFPISETEREPLKGLLRWGRRGRGKWILHRYSRA